jgi:acetyl-CoA C-acetyltransferase
MATTSIFDHMMLDGLEDAYERGRSMGTFGEDCAAKYSFTREAQDAVRHRQRAARQGRHRGRQRSPAEITPVTVKGRKGDTVVDKDEGPSRPSWTRSPRSSPRSRRTAPSPPPTSSAASTTAPPRWC